MAIERDKPQDTIITLETSRTKTSQSHSLLSCHVSDLKTMQISLKSRVQPEKTKKKEAEILNTYELLVSRNICVCHLYHSLETVKVSHSRLTSIKTLH